MVRERIAAVAAVVTLFAIDDFALPDSLERADGGLEVGSGGIQSARGMSAGVREDTAPGRECDMVAVDGEAKVDGSVLVLRISRNSIPTVVDLVTQRQNHEETAKSTGAATSSVVEHCFKRYPDRSSYTRIFSSSLPGRLGTKVKNGMLSSPVGVRVA